MKYEYAVNRSDTEYYRRRRGKQNFEYYYDTDIPYSWGAGGWQNAGGDTWKHWITPERTMPVPDSAILLKGLLDD